MQKTILAIYEDGLLKPLELLRGLAEHERVQLVITTEDMIEQRIAESERLARESVDGLTEEQLRTLEASALEQEHFFGRSQ
ncbi:antitoxin family protein [Candidatus Entotheonella palauensis]|nr:antitoxin family protein [Candidatus Entotheonella palauensis]